MKITLITGGSGSENIQRGLYQINRHIGINIIINGYDDGKSTGILRRLFKNTLGISDFRKNQVLEYNLIYGNNDTYKLLTYRFTNTNTLEKPSIYLLKLINELDIEDDIRRFLIKNTEYFFALEQSTQIHYDDFNYMNLIYCALLHQYDSNMITVCNIIKKVFGLKNNIYVNSHANLILNGITANNKVLLDEVSIVDFDDITDKIVDVSFVDNDELPVLDEATQDLLLNSDLIVLSCGTQFSSLIPTYKTVLFADTLKQSKALKYLVLNCDYDNDIVNYTGDELLDKINEYISLKEQDVKIIISPDMNPKLFPTIQSSSNLYNYINIPKLVVNNTCNNLLTHDGFVLWKYIFEDYFHKYYNKTYIFDYDYTLYDAEYLNISADNIESIGDIENKIIASNNCITNISPDIRDCVIFSNIGNVENRGTCREHETHNKECKYVNINYILNDEDIGFIQNTIIRMIRDIQETPDNLQINNMKNVSISIKPLTNRDEIIENINKNILNTDTKYELIKTGKTTIEIIKRGLSKRALFTNKRFFDGNYTYITDCNDIDYNAVTDNIKYLHVDTINTTNLFIKSLIMNKKYDICIIAGGINERMGVKYPKCLIEVDGNIVLTNILEKIRPFANNIYVCCNNYYKNDFQKYERSVIYSNIHFLYFDSLDNSQSYPKGNGETLYQLLESEGYKITKKIFVIWSDIIIDDARIFEEMYNLQYGNDFLIPTVYVEDPYAYLIIDKDKDTVKGFGYRRDVCVEMGFHDQCIFLVDTSIVKNKLKNIIKSKGEKYKELNFLDVVNDIDNGKVAYYETKYPLNSFNTFNDIPNPSGTNL
jgi:2-phospho-L-lactate transferase/gluconeogenesis factor (CofD/UPF0052 family)|uniref:MobA-like NTP transferase domain-containing protein n=1 Tax=viral metagenome TaxID=1070528 RepID=A0A6C0LVY1_9ZZZZ